MRAVILAAGRGSRMKSLTEECPKGLIPLCGKTLVERMMSSLRLSGIHDIAVITGYRRDKFDYLGLPTFHNPEWANTNMVCSLCAAADWLGRDDVIVCYSDIFVSPEIIRSLMQDRNEFALTYDRQWHDLWRARFADVLADAESFRIRDGLIQEIGNRAVSIEDIQGQYMGLFKFTPASWRVAENILERLPPERVAKLSVTPLLQHMIESGYPVHGVPVSGQWGEMDQEGDLLLYETWAKEGRFGPWFGA
ncbi:MAG: phosphocholine cytidylyltransferase family protein [Micavibrio aeruginosavorus]|uniref:Phosphocholine cytidylyltransferase family protein n=1 Tax=Micavibrio aeruginosavorus TaxID=349221 RepID=A0A7T5R2H1_9BACT|nr:MAG: phosphocholine cytidylyltransferase family protein [Micavibrio aeruginosavorus]